jgi:type VI secretion system protein ImpL
MWLWILSAVVVALAWAGWFILRPDPKVANVPGADIFPLWIPIAVTAAAILVIVGVYVFRRIRAARAARALEKAIAQQAQEQALAAKPEQRAEIQELHRQIQSGINALKASKLGGGKRGADALYSLPWYVMVGPPGAGKTTALRHSGLVFPYLDPEGGGVRGVGGTRNCDWWFTNEAILLDTAGRYTTEAEDHDEWMAFLEQLLKYRPEKPVNGVMVAVSVAELVDATEDQIQQMGKKIRARIDEMQSTLHMALPVYVLFTKTDLVSGFVEFFGDLKKSERAQPFGATIRLDADKREPGKVFDAEFDMMVEKAHERALRRMAIERNRELKEKVYQFPLEFAAIKRNLSDFLAAAFAPAAGASPVPTFRGFYFTSGTQEGRPLDRVVGAMGRAFGLRPAPEEPNEQKTESKSYFLRDVFMRVAFPDADLATRSAAVIQRERMKRYLVAAAAAAIALLFLMPAVFSFVKNRGLVADTRTISNEAAGVDWAATSTDGAAKVEKLDALRSHVELLDKYEDEGPPLGYRWFMYQGGTLFPPTLDQYRESLQQGFVRPTKERLEGKLRAATGEKFRDDYNNLKTYLLFDDKVHLQDEAAWETERLTQIWSEILRPTTELSEQDLKAKLRPHVEYYVDLLRRGLIPAEPVDKPLVDRTRDILTRVGSSQRYYDQFVTALIDEKYDEAAPASRENLVYPPVSLSELFIDRPEVLTKVRSGLKERTGKWFEVQGPYTYKGHERVVASLDEGYKLLEREQWVLPFTADEKKQGDKIQKSLDRVRQDYDAEYVRQWVNFFRDIDVAVPPNNKEAIQEFRVLSTPDWPYLRLLRALSDNTQFDDPRNQAALQGGITRDGGVLDQIKTRVERRLDTKLRTQGATQAIKSSFGIGPGQEQRVDPVPDKFRSMVGFGIVPPPPQAVEGEPPPPPPAEPRLAKYVAELEQLAGEMGTIEDGPANADTRRARESFERAVRVTEGLLLTMDNTGQELMEPLLMNPLKQAYKAVVRSAGGAASGLWEVVVWPPYREKIKDRYPFNLLATRDASYEDAVAFFQPKSGILWGFYDQYLSPFHEKVGHEFIPKGYLESRPKPARAFTPFNPNMYNCLKRADEITDALFGGGGGDKPKVVFNINLKTVSPIVSEVIFELDGQRRVYRNEKEFWYQFEWPGEKPSGAKLQVRGAGGLDEELSREGPWGIFRLIEAGTTTAQKDSDEVFTVTWQLTAPPVTVTMEVRPTRGNHPFPMSFFRATNCPPSIGDSFGPGKG